MLFTIKIDSPDGPDCPKPHEIDCELEDGIYFEPHPNSCEHYFICSFGESLLLDCAPGFYYDAENNWCDVAENVKCDNGKRLADTFKLSTNQLYTGL